MPKIIHSYNRCMGGVDLFDQFVANYRIRIRSKKWWWRISVRHKLADFGAQKPWRGVKLVQIETNKKTLFMLLKLSKFLFK